MTVDAMGGLAADVEWARKAVIKLALPSQNNPFRHKKGTCEFAKCLICKDYLMGPGGFEPPSSANYYTRAQANHFSHRA